MALLAELKRRNVLRVGAAYVVAAWLVIQVAETIFPLFGYGDTPARIVVVVLAIGLIPVLIFTWAFELTPEGLKKDSEVDRSQSITPQTGKKLDRMIMVVLALALAYFSFDKFVLDPSRDSAEREAARQEGRADALVESFGDKSIVVLPFVNISSDPEQEYLGEGLAEELLNLLAQVEGLRVISRTSAFSFKNAKITAAEIARQLNVSYVLEGSVRKSGNALRITAQLIDARADAHIWSDTYDRSTEDIFDVQDSVAGEVVGHLGRQLALDLPKVERHDPVAYALYLQARQLSNRSGMADTQRELLERALELEPDYLDAKSLLAWAHRRSSIASHLAGDMEKSEWYHEKYDSLVDEVLAQDPRHPGANALRAWENLYLGDVPRAAKYAEQALASEPTDPDALTTAGEIMNRLWRAEEAILILRYVSDRDPLNAYHFQNLAGAYLNAGQYASAEETLRTLLLLAPDDGDWTEYVIGLALLLQGKANEALQQFNENVSDDHPLNWHGKTLALHALGRTDDAQSELAKLLEIGASERTNNIYFVVGTAYAWIGATDEAFDFFERQREHDPQVFTSVGDSPLYTNLRDDPRWRPFLTSVKVDPDFLASVEFNPKLPAEIRLQEIAATR